MILLLITAVYFDFCRGKIPNAIIVCGGVTAFSIQLYLGGIEGLFRGVLGMLLPCLLLYGLFCIGAMGAGDVKLFAVIGAFLGTAGTVLCLVIAFLVGAVFSLVKMCYNGNYMVRMQCLARYVQEVIQGGRWKLYDSGTGMKNRIHFSLPILISVIVVYIGELV